jgi:hypothetical protein
MAMERDLKIFKPINVNALLLLLIWNGLQPALKYIYKIIYFFAIIMERVISKLQKRGNQL